MPRIFIILGLATLLMFGGMYCQYREQQNEQQALDIYQTVLLEKAELIYSQARDWSKPIQVDISDPRLTGDYKIMADFVLSHMIQNAEARNTYLRELKALGWDQFLNINRLEKDKKQNYTETENMLKQAHILAEQFRLQTQQREQNAVDQAKHLGINARYRHQLAENMKASLKQDEALVMFEIEMQILSKADAIFAVLKNNKWEKKKNTFMFYEDKPLQQFNALYKEVLALTAQLEQVKKQNRREVEQKL